MQLIHGPVTSKRYGHTLGVNLLGDRKVCSYDCVYCSLGPTQLTMNTVRKGYVFPTVAELNQAFLAYLRASVRTDAIVVSGNGDPTLHAEFDVMMAALRDLRDRHLPGKRIVVLSNGAHLDQKKIVAGLNLADERVIKVDAGNDALVQRVNQPLVRVNLSKFINGFRHLLSPVVQSMFVRGDVDNTGGEAIDEWIEIVGMIKPTAVQICTLDLPAPLYPGLMAADEDTLYGIAFKLKKRTGIEAKVFGAAPNGVGV